MKKFAAIIMLAAIAFLFVGCTDDTPETPEGTAAPAATPAPPEGNNDNDEEAATVVDTDREPTEFRFTRTSDASTLNAHYSNAIIVSQIYEWVHSGLYRRVPSEDGLASRIIPDIASGYPIPIGTDGLVWHIPIRPEARFHNGTPITAYTFEYSWRMLLNPDLDNAMASFLFGGQIEILGGREYFFQDPPTEWEEVGIRVIDSHTIEIETTRPFRQDQVMVHFFDRSLMPVYEQFYEEGMNSDRTQTTYGTFLDNWMGAGPFFFYSWVHDALHIYHRNPDHWLADYFHFDIVTVRVVPDAGARLTLWEQGEIDIFDVPAAMFSQFADDPRLHVLTGVMPTHIDINNLNEDNPILGTVEFRRALYFAIDRATVANITNQLPAPTYIGPEAGAFMDDGSRFRQSALGLANVPPNYGFDPDLARQYFDAALAQIDADTVTIRLLFSDAVENQRIAGEFLQQQFQEIFDGRFNLVLQPAPAAGVGAMSNWRETTDWDLRSVGWGTTQQRNFPHQAFTHMISPASRPNPFMPERFLERWDSAQELTGEIPLNFAALNQAAAELEALWMEYAINVPMWHGISHVLYAEHIELPLRHFVPALSYGIMFGRVRD